MRTIFKYWFIYFVIEITWSRPKMNCETCCQFCACQFVNTAWSDATFLSNEKLCRQLRNWQLIFIQTFFSKIQAWKPTFFYNFSENQNILLRTCTNIAVMKIDFTCFFVKSTGEVTTYEAHSAVKRKNLFSTM